jgi:predicted metal-dependent phosphoesterase TrpH
MGKIDLHIHSKFSNDGEFSVTDIIDECKTNDINLISITDHNSVKGVSEALEYCEDSLVNVIPGIEIDCVFEDIDIHLLGYNIDYKSKDFSDLETSVYKKIMESVSQMVDNLKKLNFVIDYADVMKRSGETLPSAEMMAEMMLSDERYFSDRLKPYMPGGERSDMPYINFYLDYFAQDKPAYVKIEFINFKTALELVMDNGGIPVIAHPGLNLKGREQLVEKILQKGVQGMEVFNNYHNSGQIDFFAGLARKENVIMTAGSDFHGKTKPLIKLGEYGFNEKYEDYFLKSIREITQQ